MQIDQELDYSQIHMIDDSLDNLGIVDRVEDSFDLKTKHMITVSVNIYNCELIETHL